MNDQELLELAAKAADIKPDWYERGIAINHGLGKDDHHNGVWVDIWNPLNDDVDALRLAVKLLFEIDMRRGCVAVKYSNGGKVLEAFNLDPYAATRRAIVRAAAEIGREK